MVDQDTILKAVRCLLDQTPKGSKVILFGSQARGAAGPSSDLDFLVIEPQVHNPVQEIARLRSALDAVIGPLLIPADVLVAGADQFVKWQDTPTTVYYQAAHEGRLYEDVA